MWAPGQAVVVACSGGRDSVVLLDVLHATQRAHGGRLSVLTVDHGQRAESGGDAAFVVELAEGLGLPVTATVVAPHSSSEDALRTARHRVFDRQMEGGAVVALGHHRRDQAETLLLQLLRGGGVAARRGMLPVREGRVRPLFDETPAALGAWAMARGLCWREDPTNLDLGPLRNRVRHELLPLLEALRPGAEGTLARSARLAAVDEVLLETLARDVAVDSAAWAAAPEALARRALQQRWPALQGGQVDALMAAVSAGGGAVCLTEGRVLVVVDGTVEERAVGAASGVVTDLEPGSAGLEESP